MPVTMPQTSQASENCDDPANCIGDGMLESASDHGADNEDVRYPNRVIVGAQRRAASFRQNHNRGSDSSSVNSIHSQASIESMPSNNNDDDDVAIIGTTSPNKFRYNPHSVHDNVLRRRVKYFFMNPIDKWRAKGRIPWKLFVQILKIIVITVEVIHYGMENSNHVRHQANIGVSFNEIFLQDWDTVREVMAYPPQSGPYAIYTKSSFYEYIDYAIKALSNITDMSIGSFGYSTNSSENVSPIYFCRKGYRKGETNPSTFTYNFDKTVDEGCTHIDVDYPARDSRWQQFSIQQFLHSKNLSVNFDTLLEASLRFDVRIIYLNSHAIDSTPRCYSEKVSIVFDNSLHDGQMVVKLNVNGRKEVCSGILNTYLHEAEYYMTLFLNIFVVLLCILSFQMCAISLYKGVTLQRTTVEFFKSRYNSSLDCGDQLRFIDFWIVTILINDILIICGSILKMTIEYRQTETFPHDGGAILLGVGILLVWLGILRYFGFFKKYNLIILALKRAIPDVLRFTLCAMFLYGGFCICGWVVLGPYHIKFRTLSTTSECLFALLNGDDMFATFAVLDTKNDLIWWFCRIYLYTFISLFIYVVLNLFISLILDGYETIKEYYEHGFPLSDLQRFVAECKDDPSSTSFQEDDASFGCSFRRFFSSFRRCMSRH